MNNVKAQITSWYTFLLKLVSVAVLIIAILLCPYTKQIYYKASFFYKMQMLHPPIQSLGSNPMETGVYLTQLKQIAIFLLNIPDKDRREVIFSYNDYINTDTSIMGNYSEQVVNLFLLQRLIFEVPMEYPKEDARAFVAWGKYHDYSTLKQVNLLWPFLYDNNKLTIKEPLGSFYSTYDGAMEYEYFLDRFQFRSPNSIK